MISFRDYRLALDDVAGQSLAKMYRRSLPSEVFAHPIVCGCRDIQRLLGDRLIHH